MVATIATKDRKLIYHVTFIVRVRVVFRRLQPLSWARQKLVTSFNNACHLVQNIDETAVFLSTDINVHAALAAMPCRRTKQGEAPLSVFEHSPDRSCNSRIRSVPR